MTRSIEVWRNVLAMAGAGGLAFWVASFAISRTPLAAEYRSALSISYYPMLVESLVGGLVIGLGVSYFLFRFFDRIPGNDPVTKSVIISFIVLLIATTLIGRPSSFLGTSDVSRYFLIGTIFNFIRILALGIAIGYVCKRQNKGKGTSASWSTGPHPDSG